MDGRGHLGDDCMPTSSILHDVVIDTVDGAEQLIAAMEKASGTQKDDTLQWMYSNLEDLIDCWD